MLIQWTLYVGDMMFVWMGKRCIGNIMPFICLYIVYESRIEFDSFRLYFIFKFAWFFCCYLFFSLDFSDILSVFCVRCRLWSFHFVLFNSLFDSVRFLWSKCHFSIHSSTLDVVQHFRYKFDSGAPHTTRH